MLSTAAQGFGDTIRKLRIAAGLTQAELAERARISERTVSDLERGVRGTVYPATARQLAASLGVGANEMSEFLSRARGASPAADQPADRVGALPAAQRSRVIPPLTRLLGREAELAMSIALTRDPAVRLLTIVGPGGIGKTRLATEVAMRAQEGFPGGVFFVGLSATDDPQQVEILIANAVGVMAEGADLTEAIARRLGDARALLVLDTFEHLLPAAPQVAGLLAACPSVTALVTSRSPLRVRGERELLLSPLSARPGPAGSDGAPAVRLFVERAAARVPAFDPTKDDLALISDICHRLDGLPLAIELAAAHVRHLSLATLLRHLDHRLEPLVGGARDLPARQQTMRATMDWSYALLDGRGMRTFRCLAAFRGGFDREAAAAVVLSAAEPEQVDLPTLSGLVDASLVVFEPGAGGEGRYRLLDVTRDYAVERSVAAGEFDGLRDRHADFFLTLAERTEPEFRGPRQGESFARLLADEGNFRAAMTWLLESGEFDLALRMAGALWMFWRWAGLFSEGRAWLDAALAGGVSSSLAVRCQALWGAGWLALHQGDYPRTGELGAGMLAELGGDGEPLLRRNALTLVGNGHLGEARRREAVAALTEAVALSQAAGSPWHEATSMLNLGTALMNDGEVASARGLFEAALMRYEEVGDRHFTARTLIQLGYADLALSGPEAAASSMGEAMAIVADIGDGWGIAEGLEAVASARSEGAPRETVELAAAAASLRERLSMRQHPADAIINQHHLDLARARIGPRVFDEAWAAGARMSLQEATRMAISPRGSAAGHEVESSRRPPKSR